MKEKKSIKFKTIFLIWLGICYIYNIIKILSDSAKEIDLKQEPGMIIFALIVSIIPTIITNFWILGIIFLVRRSSNKVEKENLSEIDLKKYEGYYREILNKYTPAEIEYVDNLKCNETTSIVATLLKLELLGKIKINENNIEIIDATTDNLRKTEKYILESIKDGIVKIERSGYIQFYAQDEGQEDGLIQRFKYDVQKNKKKNKKRKIVIILFFIFFILLTYTAEPINNMEESSLKTSLIIITAVIPTLGMFYMIFVYPISRLIYSAIKYNSYIRTETGEEVNKKIEGLKNYIIHYSFLDTKEKKELLIWEDYLIYSVIFGINTKIIEKMSSLIKIEYEMGRIYFNR